MSDPTDINTAALTQLAEVKGQLANITQLITLNHNATHQRIDDLRHAVEGRITGVESRVIVLEKNERATALKTATAGALSGAITSAIVAAAFAAMGHKP